MKKLEKAVEIIFLLLACVSIVAVVVICAFLFMSGLPAMFEIGIGNFLFGKQWRPGENKFGILPMIVGSVYVTLGAICIGVPIGVLTAVFLAKLCPKKLHKILKPAVELLAGIPSILYGFFALVVIVPVLRRNFPGNGLSLLAACILLGMMILPTIIGVAESAIRAVPESYYEGALALGATRERSLFCVVLPAAKSGVSSGIVLGIGRAIGETMAVNMVAGNNKIIPNSLFQGVRTLTTNIVLEMGYATDLHREALIANGVVLFVFILLINSVFFLLKKPEGGKKTEKKERNPENKRNEKADSKVEEKVVQKL